MTCTYSKIITLTFIIHRFIDYGDYVLYLKHFSIKEPKLAETEAKLDAIVASYHPLIFAGSIGYLLGYCYAYRILLIEKMENIYFKLFKMALIIGTISFLFFYIVLFLYYWLSLIETFSAIIFLPMIFLSTASLSFNIAWLQMGGWVIFVYSIIAVFALYYVKIGRVNK